MHLHATHCIDDIPCTRDSIYLHEVKAIRLIYLLMDMPTRVIHAEWTLTQALFAGSMLFRVMTRLTGLICVLLEVRRNRRYGVRFHLRPHSNYIFWMVNVNVHDIWQADSRQLAFGGLSEIETRLGIVGSTSNTDLYTFPCTRFCKDKTAIPCMHAFCSVARCPFCSTYFPRTLQLGPEPCVCKIGEVRNDH